MLQVNHLSFYRDERIIFSDLTFNLNPGQALVVTGPNGVGKSTLLRIIVGLLMPSAGSVTWDNQCVTDLDETQRAQIGYLGHKPSIKLGLTVIENLSFTKNLANHTISNNDHYLRVLNEYQLDQQKNTLAEKLSAGQKQRLALANLSVAHAKLWILDEPLTALDEASIELWQIKLNEHLNKGGMAVISSHRPIAISEMKQLNLLPNLENP